MTNYEGKAKSIYNKQQAKKRLAETDWSEFSSVKDKHLTPYLVNSWEFVSYRRALRRIAIDPPEEDILWPEKPVPIWS
jgi:hypothetical protein